jgi:hypothetical protein
MSTKYEEPQRVTAKILVDVFLILNQRVCQTRGEVTITSVTRRVIFYSVAQKLKLECNLTKFFRWNKTCFSFLECCLSLKSLNDYPAMVCEICNQCNLHHHNCITLLYIRWMVFRPSTFAFQLTVPKKKKISYPRNRSWRPIGLWDVEAFTFSTQSAQRKRWVCQPYAPAAL